MCYHKFCSMRHHFITLNAIISIVSVLSVEIGTAYYNKINFHNYTTFDEFSHSLLTVTDNGDLVTSSNIILGVSDPDCDYLLETPAFRASQRYAGGNVLISAALPASEFPYKIDGCAQVFYYRSNSPLTSSIANTTTINHQSLTVMLKDHTRMGMSVINNFPFSVDLYWNGESKSPDKQGTAKSGQTIHYTTNMGDVFSAHRSDGEWSDIVDFFVVGSESYTLSPANRLETCESYIDEPMFATSGYPACDDMEGRLLQYKMNVWYQKRLGQYQSYHS